MSGKRIYKLWAMTRGSSVFIQSFTTCSSGRKRSSIHLHILHTTNEYGQWTDTYVMEIIRDAPQGDAAKRTTPHDNKSATITPQTPPTLLLVHYKHTTHHWISRECRDDDNYTCTVHVSFCTLNPSCETYSTARIITYVEPHSLHPFSPDSAVSVYPFIPDG